MTFLFLQKIVLRLRLVQSFGSIFVQAQPLPAVELFLVPVSPLAVVGMVDDFTVDSAHVSNAGKLHSDSKSAGS